MLTFFNHAADDLSMCVFNLQNARFCHIRGTTMKTSSSLNYIQLVLLPVLTSLFDHLAVNDFGYDLLLDDIQVASYKILNSMYTLGTKHAELTLSRKFIKAELDSHRSSIGSSLRSFSIFINELHFILQAIVWEPSPPPFRWLSWSPT